MATASGFLAHSVRAALPPPRLAIEGQMQQTRSRLTSSACTQQTLLSPAFQDWAERLRETRGHLHRKVWEWCYIAQALREHGVLEPGRIGLGFAVGEEPLSAMFATCGARIIATDLCTAEAQAGGWVDTAQHAEGYEAINKRGICEDRQLRSLVEFEFADMNAIGSRFDGRFDFVWSSCALEHLGSLEHGKRFIVEAMKCLKHGGVAVHTTEFNVSSNDATIESGDTVLFRRKDIEDVARRLRDGGHHIVVDFDAGSAIADEYVDVPPYRHDIHLKIQIAQYVVTSFGLIIQRG